MKTYKRKKNLPKLLLGAAIIFIFGFFLGGVAIIRTITFSRYPLKFHLETKQEILDFGRSRLKVIPVDKPVYTLSLWFRSTGGDEEVLLYKPDGSLYGSDTILHSAGLSPKHAYFLIKNPALGKWTYQVIPIHAPNPYKYELQINTEDFPVEEPAIYGPVENLEQQSDSGFDEPERDDVIPPRTEIVLTPKETKRIRDMFVASGPVTVSLVPNEKVSHTLYWLNDEKVARQYTAPIEISQDGITTLRFYSHDVSHNSEESRTVYIKVGK